MTEMALSPQPTVAGLPARRLAVPGAPVSQGAVEKHISSIFDKLGLARDSADDHRRVLAVLAWLGSTSP